MSDDGLIFLGLCERAAYVRDGNTNIFKWNILGLKHVVISCIYPLPFQGVTLGFAIAGADSTTRHHIQLVDDAGKEVGTIALSFATQAFAPDTGNPTAASDCPMVMLPQVGWQTVFVPITAPGFVVERPGLHRLRLQTARGVNVLGELHFFAVDPPPLSEDRIAAIQSDPDGTRAVGMEYGCKVCSYKFRVYAALARIEQMEEEGWSWYQNIPEALICQCKTTQLDVTLIRKNLHAILGHRPGQGGQVNYIPLYEKSSLETIRTNFAQLVSSAKKEEQLQQFIQNNPVVLHQFPAERLFPKPAILTFFAADFAILSPQRELLLIELEKPDTRLLKKDGGIAASLSHAFDQVRDWLHTVDEHRVAVLDCLKINRDQVSSVRAVVIAGRDSGYDAYHLRKLKGEDRGRVRFFTYDDLTYSLDHLIKRLDAL
jgi:Domain of unknown function (DUF4263)